MLTELANRFAVPIHEKALVVQFPYKLQITEMPFIDVFPEKKNHKSK